MSRIRNTVVLVTALTLASVAASGASAGGPRAVASSPPRAEAERVDTIPTPKLHWHTCQRIHRCAQVQLPLDYDEPAGATVTVALLKVPARDASHRIGSLFLNPGGPGGSGKDVAVRAAEFLSPAVLDRFDLIGMDPRGTNDSSRVECYPDAEHQAHDTDVLSMIFPSSRHEERAYSRAAGHLAAACSAAGQPLASSISTTEVARDMDVLRRAVGDRQLTFLGWSYGTYLGQVYANLFPDRVRALAIDGVLDPVAWRGDRSVADIPMTMRLDSAGGSSRALTTLLDRCRRAGPEACPIMPDPAAAFASVATALRAKPLAYTDEDGSSGQITYADFVHSVLLSLYVPEGVEDVPAIVALLQEMLAPKAGSAARAHAATRYGRVLHRTALARERAGFANEPLANDFEVNAAVACSDSRNPRDLRRWNELADRADRQAPYFGRFWLWTSATCANWTARDEDAYTGPFDRRTSHPVLVVGNLYDPATNYDSAVAVSRRLPNSRLLSSDSWGHTAYGTSRCITGAMDRYLIDLALPKAGLRCRGDHQPYAG